MILREASESIICIALAARRSQYNCVGAFKWCPSLVCKSRCLTCVQVVVSGLHSNNTANILGSFPVCNSTVYITDLVLLPADSLAAIPQAPATAAAPAAAPMAAPAAAVAAAPAAAPTVAPVAAAAAAAPKTGPVAAQSLATTTARAAAPATASAAAGMVGNTGPAPATGTGQPATGFTAVGSRNFGRR